MNTQVGKSVGIALLLAAGLLAALFAMGVFSPSGAGAQSTGPTATASLVDMNDTATSNKADDTLVITFRGLTAVSGATGNEVEITMPDDLGTLADDAVTWSGGNQFATVTTSALVYTAASGDGPGHYAVSFGNNFVISGGTAVLEITTTANNIDTNSKITALTVGRGDEDAVTQNTVTNVPINIANAPAGPRITLEPSSVIFDPAPTDAAGDAIADGAGVTYMVTVKGSGFTAATEVTLATEPDRGTGTVPQASVLANGTFSFDLTLTQDKQAGDANEHQAESITVTTTQGTDNSSAMFVINRAPTVSVDETGVFFESENASAQQVTVTHADPDGHTLDIDQVSSDTDVATVTRSNNVITVSPQAPGTATVTVTADDGYAGGEVTTTFDVTVLGVVSSTNKADADVVLEIIGRAEAPIRGGRDIVVGLSGYFIPEGGILEDDVLVTGAGDSYYGNPADVSVSGSSVTITIPTKIVGMGGRSEDTEVGVGGYTVRFKDGAGLRNPNSAGSKTVTVSDADDTAHRLPVSIISHISVKPGWVSRGDMFTITGKGINANGDTTAHLYTGTVSPDKLTNAELVESSRSIVLGKSSRDGGTVVVDEVSTKRSDFEAEATNATENPDVDAKGTNLIVMVDAAGVVVGYTYLGLLPNVELDVTDVRRTGEVVVTVSDWYYGDHIDLVRINGITVNLRDNTNRPSDEDSEPDPWVHPDTRANHREAVDSDGDAEFIVVVDRNTRLGEMQVDLRGYRSYLKQGSASSPDTHKQTVQVGFFPLTLTPSTAVTEQVIQVEGEEFLARTCITSITVGERTIEEATNGDRVSAEPRDCVDTDGNGKLTATFKVPRGLLPGEYSLVVRDDGNRVGEAKLVVPAPAITLDPATSQRGSTVTVVGENFPADDVVTIDYRGVTVEATETDTRGDFRGTFQVPITAPIGATHEVIAASENKADGREDTNQPEVVLTAKGEHRVSDETLEFDRQQVAPGEQLGIIAGNLPLFNPVSISIGGRDVAGKVLGEDNASDGFGRYEDSVLVPQLPAGFTIVELIVHTERGDDVRVSEFVQITNIVTRPTNEVFANIIAANQLVVVWKYDNETASWASYDPTAPAELNDLNLVSNGDIVWVETTESVDFQGVALYTGWNLITLE